MANTDAPIDYLVVGTTTRDVVPGTVPHRYTAGGTATYSGRLAQALGCTTAVLTSASARYALSELFPNIQLKVVPAEQDTIYDNIYEANRRVQILHGVSSNITPADVPMEWTNASILHLGPLNNDVDPHIVDLFPNSLIGLTPQGWMRRWDSAGRVYAQRFEAAEWILGKADAVVISEEDLLDDTMLDEFRRWSNILVMTENYMGCTIFMDGGSWQIPAPEIQLVEPTGAGDIFAAAFFVQLWRNGGDAAAAAEFANLVAAYSVTQRDMQAKVTAWQAAV